MSDTKQNTITMRNNYYSDEMAISHVIGIVLMVASTIVIAGVIIVMLGWFVPPDIPPYAIISVSDAEGGTTPITLRNNSIRILHRGGDMLCVNETMIVMQGYGQTRPAGVLKTGWVGTNVAYPILVTYNHTYCKGKDTSYRTRNSNLLADGYWSAGEILDLNGHDSDDIIRPASSIRVIRLDDNSSVVTSDNWQFKPNSKIRLLIIDIPSNQVISSTTLTMRQFI